MKIRVAIIGASGYTGEELVRWVLRHPHLQLAAVTSRQAVGQRLTTTYSLPPHLSTLSFEDLTPAQVLNRADVFFLALPHGVAAEFAVPFVQADKIVVDLSADFRLRSPATYQEFYGHPHPAPSLLSKAVYANPTLHRAEIAKSNLLAAPGCYPTSILLALAPAVHAGLIDLNTLHIHSSSGISGAGKKAEIPYLFCEAAENMRPYSVPKHRHLSEIEQELALLGKLTTPCPPVTFIPHIVPLHRGMLTSITAALRSPDTTEAMAQAAYEKFYKNEPFIRLLSREALPEAKHVARTNWCELALRVDARTKRFHVFSAIDNLVRGAGGQAIQALNVRLGLDETEGLDA